MRRNAALTTSTRHCLWMTNLRLCWKFSTITRVIIPNIANVGSLLKRLRQSELSLPPPTTTTTTASTTPATSNSTTAITTNGNVIHHHWLPDTTLTPIDAFSLYLLRWVRQTYETLQQIRWQPAGYAMRADGSVDIRTLLYQMIFIGSSSASNHHRYGAYPSHGDGNPAGNNPPSTGKRRLRTKKFGRVGREIPNQTTTTTTATTTTNHPPPAAICAHPNTANNSNHKDNNNNNLLRHHHQHLQHLQHHHHPSSSLLLLLHGNGPGALPSSSSASAANGDHRTMLRIHRRRNHCILHHIYTHHRPRHHPRMSRHR